jgi:4-alpha-glucanotransferase
LLISAPRRAWRPEGAPRTWGLFAPLYALHSARSWGAGDFQDLEDLAMWAGEQGCRTVATLPLLPAFLDRPPEPSPYAPISRLAWNEFYLDVTRVPEFAGCSAPWAREVQALRATESVDYRRVMRVKRAALQIMSDSLFAGSNARRRSLEQFVRERRHVQDYARFRAAGERYGTDWRQWPQPLRDGRVRPNDVELRAVRYHLYVQWLADEQMHALCEHVRRGGVGLCLDLPLGVHPDGYDCWRYRDAFALGATTGAPPDPFFTRGQNWGFPPPHPQALRRQQYEYVIAYLRHHMRHAAALRIDHVMGLHRLYWIPQGFEARDGVYARYPADELYAILCLESHRHRTLIVGENLGTVPAFVNRQLGRHGIQKLFVAQFQIAADARHALPKVPRNCVASLNTHDLPMFAGFWGGRDIDDRFALGLLDARMRQQERRTRGALKITLAGFLRKRGLLAGDGCDVQQVLAALLRFLGGSAARLVLVNIEDLWGELRPQNTPGTHRERPNWTRKARYALEDMPQMRAVTQTLEALDAARRRPSRKARALA